MQRPAWLRMTGGCCEQRDRVMDDETGRARSMLQADNCLLMADIRCLLGVFSTR